MTRPDPNGRFGEGLAATLRVGTIVAVLVVAVGFVVASMTGLPSRGGRPLVEVVLGAGPDAPIAVGLFGLTLIPIVALGYAARRFSAAGERQRFLTTLVVLALLVVGLAIAVVIGASS